MSHQISASQYQLTEWRYLSKKSYADPFNDIELDVILTDSDGQSWCVPAYWAGGNEWRVRFAPPRPGTYQIISVCSDQTNTDLHGQESTLAVSDYRGDNPLLKHGSLKVAASRRTFEYEDGTPFFWLADTWWMGLCQRLKWPEDFQLLTADRIGKGFTVIQIVAGLYPDMPAFDERGANEAGFPWDKDFERINPAYFDMADLRIQWLVRSGLAPCIVGCWGYYLPMLGIQKMKQHWRNLVARWGAYPVVWCLAGEAAMPYYLSPDKEQDRDFQIAGWTEIGRYVRQIDPYQRLITIHPTQVGRDQVEDDSILDFNMLQTGHDGYRSVPNTIATITKEYHRKPTMPVLVGETNYEGILHGTQTEVQRLTFWSAMLSGAAGHTYGANGIWQVNTRQQPYGASPHGANWGDTPWEDAYQLPGSTELGLAKKLLQRYEWWLFEPHQNWVDPCGSPENVDLPFAAGIPGKVRIIYFYLPTFPWMPQPIVVKNIEPDISHYAFFWDPRTGQEHTLGIVKPDEDGSWEIPLQPMLSDWVLVREAKQA